MVPAKRRSEDEGRGGGRGKVLVREGAERDFRCPYFVRDPADQAHAECREKMFPNPRKLKWVFLVLWEG